MMSLSRIDQVVGHMDLMLERRCFCDDEFEALLWAIERILKDKEPYPKPAFRTDAASRIWAKAVKRFVLQGGSHDAR